MALKGSCLCGSVNYTADAEPVMVAACHCPDCQKQTGTAYSVIVGVPANAVHMNGDSLKTYQTTGDSGKAVNRKFCGECGSPVITAVDVAPDLLFIKGGTLDDMTGLTVGAQLFCETKADWAELSSATTEFARNATG